MIPYRQPDGRPRVRREDQLLFESADFRVGLFEARTDDPHFRFSAVPDEHLIVFPCSSTRIEHDCGAAFVADRNVVTFYNPGDIYRRSEVSARGDRAHWFALSGQALDSLGAPRGKAGFGARVGLSDPATYRQQNEIVRSLVRGAVTPPSIEAAVRSIAARLLASSLKTPMRPPSEADVMVAERARTLLAQRYAETLSLAALADEIGCSTSRLSHAFRRVTGTSVHAYRDQLRLRRALLDLPERRGRLTDLGLELGYSSHSHFTERFRRTFRRPPSAI